MQRWHRVGDGINLLALNDDDVDPGQTQYFTYDDEGRLLTATGPYGDRSWSYDLVGNRLSETRTPPGGGATTSTYSYPATSNRLGSVVQGATTERALNYDAAGNITADARSGVTYAYRINDAGRLDQVTVGGTLKGQYVYDGRQRLAIRERLNSTPSGTTHLIHDASDRVISGIGHVLKAGCRWRDLPSEYGPATTIYHRNNRWSRRGLWQRLFEQVAATGDVPPELTLDSTHVKAHRSASGRKGGGGAGSRAFAGRAHEQGPLLGR